MFIHEGKNWPNFSWNHELIDPLLQQGLLAVGRLSGRMEAIGFDTRIRAMLEAVSSDVIASSEIEGIKLDLEQVRSFVARRLGVEITAPRQASHYVEGVVEMMLNALDHRVKGLTQSRLFKWHTMLFPSRSDLTVGAYRHDEMSVISGMFGRERLHYRAPAPSRLEQEMTQFLNWANSPSNPPGLLKSAVAHLWFVSIHPFDDGNGRIARAISDMMLASMESNEEGMRFYSLSQRILKDKNHYYKVLERTQRSESGDITEWLQWYINAFIGAIEDSDTLLSAVLRKAKFWNIHASKAISERQRKVLNCYLDGYEVKLTAKNWAKVAEISKDTALRDIDSLVKLGILIPTPGRVRDIPYSLSYSNAPNAGANFSQVTLNHHEDGTYTLAALFRGITPVSDRVSDIDILRMENGEITQESLLTKYFGYLLE